MTKIFSLEGKVALITSASRGLGRAMALAHAECTGHTLIIDRGMSVKI